MASIVLGLGTSHSPVLILTGPQWEYRASDDRANPSLNTMDGRLISYDQLRAERGERFTEQSNPAHFPGLAQRAEAALDRLEAELFAAKPDVVLIVGDDQGELFKHENLPAISIFYGPELVMRAFETMHNLPKWITKEILAGYHMDLPHTYPGAPELGRELIEGLIERGVDIASSSYVADPKTRGFGHAFGFVLQRLMRRVKAPILPILMNTYFPPNTPTPARCYEIGTKIADVIRSSKRAERIAVVASGGLSHFLCEEELDHRVLKALRERDIETLKRLSPKSLLEGSSEIRNWITVAGMVPDMQCRYSDYIPVYRTPVGTGIGLGFWVWSRDGQNLSAAA